MGGRAGGWGGGGGGQFAFKLSFRGSHKGLRVKVQASGSCESWVNGLVDLGGSKVFP